MRCARPPAAIGRRCRSRVKQRFLRHLGPGGTSIAIGSRRRWRAGSRAAARGRPHHLPRPARRRRAGGNRRRLSRQCQVAARSAIRWSTASACTMSSTAWGRAAIPTRSRSPLCQNLLAAGLARPDALRLGLDVDHSGRLIGRAGAVAGQLFAIGPPTRGIFWDRPPCPTFAGMPPWSPVPRWRRLARALAGPARDMALAGVLS